MATGDFETVKGDILAFRDERDWKQFHNPKDLAISINLEAAELLECFQWSGADTVNASKREAMLEELADVMICCVNMVDALDADPVEIMSAKLAKNAAHYPAEKARGNAKKYTEL